MLCDFIPESANHPLSALYGQRGVKIRREGMLVLLSLLPPNFTIGFAEQALKAAGYPPNIVKSVRPRVLGYHSYGFLDRFKPDKGVVWRFTPKGKDVVDRILASAEILQEDSQASEGCP